MSVISYTYRIPGEPLAHVQDQEGKQRIWSIYKQEKTRYLITLESQHDDKPILKSPLSLELQFYQCESWGKKELSCYSRFVECILRDVVYYEQQPVHQITCMRKRVKKDPQTIIIISEIEPE